MPLSNYRKILRFRMECHAVCGSIRWFQRPILWLLLLLDGRTDRAWEKKYPRGKPFDLVDHAPL